MIDRVDRSIDTPYPTTHSSCQTSSLIQAVNRSIYLTPPPDLRPANMTGRGGGGGRRVLLPPINFIFKLLQQHSTVQIWLYEQLAIRIEGKIRGFDEFMNLVIDDAVEVKQITKTNDKETRRNLGQILLKGDNVSLIQSLSG